ncbi:MAG: FkbM family methyltransferase [Beijerinckiaceae bacterium]
MKLLIARQLPAVTRGANVEHKSELMGPRATSSLHETIASASPQLVSASGNGVEVDLVISPNEISFAHGTGVLLSRLLENRTDLIAMRSLTTYGGQQRINAKAIFALPDGMTDRQAIFAQVLDWLKNYKVRSIICAPYFETDLKLAIAAQAITGAPLGLWIMDDNCIRNTGISREVMTEAIGRASALFAISPQLKNHYQNEFRRPIAVLPPLVAPGMVRDKASPPATSGQVIMIGNVWSTDWLDKTSRVVEAAGLKVKWYASNPDLWSGTLSRSTLAARGIEIVEAEDPEQLQQAVIGAVAVLIPSDAGSSGGHEAALGEMSLPTRMPFVLATAGTPMIVLGRPGTAAAAFVERFDVGRVIPYEGEALAKAVKSLATKEQQTAVRKRAAAVAGSFSFAGADEFVFSTIANSGRWPTDKFERLLPARANTFGYFIDKPASPQFATYFGEVVSFCDRIKGIDFNPDFILDIGASTAIWSNAVSSVFENARYILCDPMFSRYPKVWTKPGFELIEAAISDKPGKAEFSVSSDLYGSSLISVSNIVAVVDKVSVPIMTIDQIAKDKKLKGRGILKIDVQFAEHLVVEGALATIRDKVDIVILELTLARVHPSARTLLEMSNRMMELGFRMFDQVGGWRVPTSGELEQLDVVFVREGLENTLISVASDKVAR